MLTEINRIKYSNSILDTIGRTPLVRLNQVIRNYHGYFFAKVEYFNPGGSVKDRIGLGIIEEAEKSGQLKPGGTIVEATSGNTGAGLAIAAAVKGYRCIFTLPDKMSDEKIRLLRAYGAEVIITPTAVPHESPESYTEVAKRIVRETPNSILANQYYNPKNNEAHYTITGPEIWEQTGGQIDYFIAGIGTGGTISGTGKYLKEQNPNVKVIGIDPQGSILRDVFYSRTPQYEGKGKPYKVEGIGQDFIPGTLHLKYLDDIVEVTDKESFLMARRLTREEGIFVGGSAGTAVAGMLKYASNFKPDDVIVVLLPDTGERYLSKIYNDDWMRENGFLTPEKITLRYILEGKSKKIPAIVSVAKNQTIRSALELIKDHNISQLPVFENGSQVGSLDEAHVMRAVIEESGLLDKPVEIVMQEPFPELAADDRVNRAVEALTKKNPAVLVKEGNKYIGIISRYDIIEYVAV
jgi:cystathionine beta-synthase